MFKNQKLKKSASLLNFFFNPTGLAVAMTLAVPKNRSEEAGRSVGEIRKISGTC